jgi:hypothetical protein
MFFDLLHFLCIYLKSYADTILDELYRVGIGSLFLYEPLIDGESIPPMNSSNSNKRRRKREEQS